jgi:hypothetical protein
MAAQLGTIFGHLIGGLIAVFLVYALLHWAIFRRIISDPLSSRLSAAFTAYPCSVILQELGTGSSEQGNFNLEGLSIYLLPTIFVVLVAFRSGKVERREAQEQDISDVF